MDILIVLLTGLISVQLVMAESGDLFDDESPCSNGSVRLVNATEGRFVAGAIQLCFNDVWGTVCQKFWGIEETRVTCRELNLSTSEIGYCSDACFGKVNSSIRLTQFNCTGKKSKLADCAFLKKKNSCISEIGIICGNTSWTSKDDIMPCMDHPSQFPMEPTTTIQVTSIKPIQPTPLEPFTQLLLPESTSTSQTMSDAESRAPSLQLKPSHTTLSFEESRSPSLRSNTQSNKPSSESMLPPKVSQTLLMMSQMPAPFATDSLREESAKCRRLRGALGAVTGLMGVALMGVVIGWILTCRKKNKRKLISSGIRKSQQKKLLGLLTVNKDYFPFQPRQAPPNEEPTLLESGETPPPIPPYNETDVSVEEVLYHSLNVSPTTSLDPLTKSEETPPIPAYNPLGSNNASPLHDVVCHSFNVSPTESLDKTSALEHEGATASSHIYSTLCKTKASLDISQTASCDKISTLQSAASSTLCKNGTSLDISQTASCDKISTLKSDESTSHIYSTLCKKNASLDVSEEKVTIQSSESGMQASNCSFDNSTGEKQASNDSLEHSAKEKQVVHNSPEAGTKENQVQNNTDDNSTKEKEASHHGAKDGTKEKQISSNNSTIEREALNGILDDSRSDSKDIHVSNDSFDNSSMEQDSSSDSLDNSIREMQDSSYSIDKTTREKQASHDENLDKVTQVPRSIREKQASTDNLVTREKIASSDSLDISTREKTASNDSFYKGTKEKSTPSGNHDEDTRGNEVACHSLDINTKEKAVYDSTHHDSINEQPDVESGHPDKKEKARRCDLL